MREATALTHQRATVRLMELTASCGFGVDRPVAATRSLSAVLAVAVLIIGYVPFSLECDAQPAVSQPAHQSTMESELPRIREAIEGVSRAVQPDTKKADDLAAKNLKAQLAAVEVAQRGVEVAWASAAISAIALIGLGITLWLNSKAVVAANAAVRAAREGSAAESRAWLSAKCSMTDLRLDVTQDGSAGVAFTVVITTRNHGNSPATDVFFHASHAMLMAGSNWNADIEANQQKWLLSQGAGLAIFPGESLERSVKVFMSNEKIYSSELGPELRFINPIVYGCVVYKTPSVDGVRQTRFSYRLSSVINGVHSLIPTAANDIHIQRLELTTPPTLSAS